METTKKLLKRTSTKVFKKQKMKKTHLKIIKDIINNSPTSMNHQQFSAIIIEDQKTKNFIAKNNWNQEHIKKSSIFILFLADRTIAKESFKNKKIKFDKEINEYEYIRSIIDATIAATYIQTALIDLDYGVTMVGGINFFADKLIERLNIENYAFPIVGLSVGITKEVGLSKPKMNKVFFEKYNSKEFIEEAKRYNLELKKHKKTTEWKESIAEWNNKKSKVSKAIKKSGNLFIKWKKEFKK